MNRVVLKINRCIVFVRWKVVLCIWFILVKCLPNNYRDVKQLAQIEFSPWHKNSEASQKFRSYLSIEKPKLEDYNHPQCIKNSDYQMKRVYDTTLINHNDLNQMVVQPHKYSKGKHYESS